MSDLTITRTVERWVRHRWSNRLYEAGTWAAALVIVIGAVLLVVMTWAPGAAAVLLFAPVALIGVAVFVWFLTRGRPDSDSVAALVDDEAGTEGVLRTALAVERGLASGGEDPAAVVLEHSRALLPGIEELAAPRFELPLVPVVIASVALVLTMLLVVPVWLFASGDDPVDNRRIALDGAAFDAARLAALEAASGELGELAAQPGVTPEAKARLLEARDRIRAAMQSGADAQQAASELDRARAALEKAQLGALRSAEALRATRPEQLAQGLDAALERSDRTGARRVGDEILRRVDGGANDGELRRIGRALAEGVQHESRAGQRAREAGQALQAGERTDALSALAELMATLGEPVRYEGAEPALAEAEAAVEDARDQALERLDEAERRARGEGPERAEGAPEMPEDATPAPADIPSKGGQGDGGGGAAEGGTEDLREGGTPGATEEPPEVGADGERPDGERAVGPDGNAGRSVAGDGGATDGAVSPDEQGGDGTGPAESSGGAPSESETGGAAMLVGGPGPASGGGGGSGGGAEYDVPLLDLDPSTIEKDWVASQWNGAGDAMEGVVSDADAGGRSNMAWGEVHSRYAAIAESATRRGSVPLTRRAYVRRYFEAIRPEGTEDSEESE